MNCQQVNKLLERYDEGDLPPQISTQVEGHIRSCSSCQTKQRLVEKERLCLQSNIDIPALAPDFAQNVMARLAASSHPILPPLVPIWVEWIRRYPTLIGAAAVILLFIFPMLGQPDKHKELLPPANSVKQIATLETAQNIPYGSTALTEQPVQAPDNSFRSEDRMITRDGPSRSTPSLSKTGGTDAAAPAMKTMAAPGNVGTDEQAAAPAVVPSYIPEGYLLDKIDIKAGNQVSVSYLAADNQVRSADQLVITITPDNPLPLADSEDTAPQQEVKLMSLTPPSGLSEGRGVYEKHSYKITSSIPLKDKEMENLINSLSPQQAE